jgi:hypothetical protein
MGGAEADRRYRPPTYRLRSAWAVVGHSSFELADYPTAEQAWRLLSMTAADDKSRQALVDNLATSIYKQGGGEREQDYRLPRMLPARQAGPRRRPYAPPPEYDAGAALIQLQDWTPRPACSRHSAARIRIERVEATKQIALSISEQADRARWRV